MSDKIFLDTNILIYLFSTEDIFKQKVAKNLISEDYRNSTVVWSTQIIQEFFNVSTKKLGSDPLAVKKSIKRLDYFELVTVNFEMILEAIDLKILYKYSFWDSLVIAAALFANCDILFSEDMQHNQSVNGIRIINPFKNLGDL